MSKEKPKCVRCGEREAYWLAYPVCRPCWAEVCLFRAEVALRETKRSLREMETRAVRADAAEPYRTMVAQNKGPGGGAVGPSDREKEGASRGQV